MKNVFVMTIIVGILAFSWFSYNVVDARQSKALEIELASTKAELEKAKADARGVAATAFSKREEIKRALLIVFPQNGAQIEAAFNPPTKTEVPVPVEASLKAPAMEKGEPKK